MHRQAIDPNVAHGGVFDAGPEAPALGVPVFVDALLGALDGGRREPGIADARGEIEALVPASPELHVAVEFVLELEPAREAVPARVFCPALTDEFPQGSPLLVEAAGDRDPVVFALSRVDVVRRHRRELAAIGVGHPSRRNGRPFTVASSRAGPLRVQAASVQARSTH